MSDAPLVETSCDVNNGGCDHVCSDTGMGVSCHCREGYRLLSDGATCQGMCGMQHMGHYTCGMQLTATALGLCVGVPLECDT